MRHVLYFTAEWCNPCTRVKPIVEEINKTSITKFILVDADENTQLVEDFGIKSIPTYILIEDGKEIKRMSSTKTKQEFLDFIGE